MTVDVEDWFQVQALTKAITHDSWGSQEYRVEANTCRLLSMFADKGVQATFFILGWVAQKSPALVRMIQSAGHELACHGWSHRLVFDQTMEEFRQETVRAKGVIEDIGGHKVRGYRASTYSITRRSLWALDVLVDAGFEYDSSIFPVRHDVYGIPDAARWPGRITTPSGAALVEFPMSTLEIGPMRLPVSGGGYFRILPYEYTQMGLRRLNVRESRPFVFYLHPWEVDPDQPRVRVGWFSNFRHYTNLKRTASRLRRLLDEFSFTTMERVLIEAGLLVVADNRNRN